MSKKEKEETKVSFESIIKAMKGSSIVGIVLCCLSCFVIVFCTTIYTIGITEEPITKLKKDQIVMDYVGQLNQYSYSETIHVFSQIDDKVEFVLFELIIPSIILVFGYILLIISLKQLIELIKNVKSKKTLFTEEKYELLKKITLRTDIATLFILGNINLLLWLLVGFLIELIQYLFACSVHES